MIEQQFTEDELALIGRVLELLFNGEATQGLVWVLMKTIMGQYLRNFDQAEDAHRLEVFANTCLKEVTVLRHIDSVDNQTQTNLH